MVVSARSRARVPEPPHPRHDRCAAGAGRRGVGEDGAVIGRVHGHEKSGRRRGGQRCGHAGVPSGVVAGPDGAPGVVDTPPVCVDGAEAAGERDALDQDRLGHLHPDRVWDHETVRVCPAPAAQRRREPAAARVAADADARQRQAIKVVSAALTKQAQPPAHAARAAHTGEHPPARHRLAAMLTADADGGDDAPVHDIRRADPSVGDSGGVRRTDGGQQHGRADEQTQGPVADRRGHSGWQRSVGMRSRRWRLDRRWHDRRIDSCAS